MEKILLTGANGYLGAQLCRHLSQQAYRVSGLCWPETPAAPQWQQQFDDLFVCDIRDRDGLEKIAEKGFDAVIHLVSLDHHQSNGDPDFVASINVTPTESLLDIFSRQGLKKFLYFSTIHVYGKNLQGVVMESTPVHPANPYAYTHWQSEEIVRRYAAAGAVNGMVVRLSNSYGAPVFPDNNCWWLVVNDLCRSAVKDKKIVLQSDGSPLRDFIHGTDVCRAVQCLLQGGENGGVYHISSGHTRAILELAGKVQEVYRERYGDIIPVMLPGNNNVTDFRSFAAATRYTIDNSKLKDLGFVPEYTLERGIAELFGYLEELSC